MLDLLETAAGAFNASGPATPLTFGTFLHDVPALGARRVVWPDMRSSSPPRRPWTDLPLYAGEDVAA